MMTTTYIYNPDAPPPPLDQEALGILCSARGPSVVVELDEAIATLDAELTTRRKSADSVRAVRELISFAPGVLNHRATYLARRQAAAKIVKFPGEGPGEPPGLPELMALVRDGVDPGIRQAIERRLGTVKDKLAKVEQELAIWTGIAGREEYFGVTTPLYEEPQPVPETQPIVGGPLPEGVRFGGAPKMRPIAKHEHIWHQDANLLRLNRLCSQRRAFKADAVALGAQSDRAAALIGHRVQLAIDAAGGRDEVYKQLIAAAALRATPADDGTAEAERQLAKLAAAGFTSGPAVDHAKAALAEAKAAAKKAKERDSVIRQQSAEQMLTLALSGDESGRLALETTALGCPFAFQPGFVEMVGAARFDKACFASLAAAVAGGSR
jgi:hypothetical protein